MRHAIEGYAPGIPTAGLLSGFNQYGEYSTLVEAAFGCGYAAAAPSTPTTACLRLVGGSSRKRTLEGEEVHRFRRLLLLLQVRIGVRHPVATRSPIFYSLATPAMHKLETWLG